jgi:L-alanine-DL-glutamate epimerase-like enolase superfamily enzyme
MGHQIETDEHLLVRLTTSDGVVGYGEAVPRPIYYGETVVSIRHAICQLIAPRLIGFRLTDREAIRYRLRHLAANPAAKSGVDMAVWDALGKTLGVPCYRLLGGFRDTVRCTALIGEDPPEIAGSRAADFRRQHGITAFKVKVGADLTADIARIEAVRTAVGEDALIYPDANQELTDREAAARLEAFASARIAWFEEPCHGGNILGRERLCRQSSVPILGDETCTNLREVATEVLGSRVSMVSLKAARTGLTESLRIRAFCEATGIGMVVGTRGEGVLGTLVLAALAASAPSTVENPAELGYILDVDDPFAVTPAIVDGVLKLPDQPGFGCVLDEDAISRSAVAARAHTD